MKFRYVTKLPGITMRSRADVTPLLGKLRRDEWLELTIVELKELTNVKTAQSVQAHLDNGKQHVAMRQRFMGKSNHSVYFKAY